MCPCFKLNQECDPDICICDHPDSKSYCVNTFIHESTLPRTFTSTSNLCPSLGLFTAEPLCKNQFICEYLGELISISEGNRRGNLADLIEENYLYTVDEKRNIDAKHLGSRMKFANNSFGAMVNCTARIITSH